MIVPGSWELWWIAERQWQSRPYETIGPILDLWNSGQWPEGGYAKRLSNGDTYNAKEMGWLHVCRNCGHVGMRGQTSALNGCVLVVLFLLLIIPGIVYMVWGMTTPGRVHCRSCLAEGTLVPISSPQARELVK